MNCPHINRAGKPAGWLHRLFCKVCREAESTDSLLAYGIAQLKSYPVTADSINTTLSAIGLPSVPLDYTRYERKRLRKRTMARFGKASVLAAACAFGYVNWTPAVTIPARALPASNSYALMAEASRHLTLAPGGYHNVLPSLLSTTPVAEKTRLSLQKAVTANQQALTILQSCQSIPYVQPLLTTHDAPKSGRPDLHQIGELLSADAVYKARYGSSEAALDAALTEIELGQRVAGGGAYMSVIHGVIWQGQGRRVLWYLLPSLSAEQAARAARRMEQVVAIHTPFEKVAQTECAMSLEELVTRLHSLTWRYRFFTEFSPPDHRPTQIESAAAACYLYTFSNRNILNSYLKFQTDTLEKAKRPYLTGDERDYEPTDPVNALIWPVYQGAQYEDTEAQAQNALLTVTLALHAYHLAKGEYPARLEPLCPGYLASIPADPFQPETKLRYSPTLDYIYRGSHDSNRPHPVPIDLKCLLYSIGPDGVDQGGTVIYQDGQTENIYTVLSNSTGDIVAGINH